MGDITRRLYEHIMKESEVIFAKANKNYMYIDSYAKNLKIKRVIEPKSEERIVSPRISFLVNRKDRSLVFEIAKKHKIELTTWFKNSPPETLLDLCKLSNIKNANKLGSTIVNLPIYWTFSKKELNKISNFIRDILII